MTERTAVEPSGRRLWRAGRGPLLFGVVLVVLGLLISIPMVVWGSTLILRWIERFPSILYVGGAVLAWTAAKMIVSEPFVAEWLQGRSAASGLIYVGIIGGVLGAAALRNRRATPARNRMETSS